MASNNQERCIYLIPPAVYNDRLEERCVFTWDSEKSFGDIYKAKKNIDIYYSKEGNDRNWFELSWFSIKKSVVDSCHCIEFYQKNISDDDDKRWIWHSTCIQ